MNNINYRNIICEMFEYLYKYGNCTIKYGHNKIMIFVNSNDLLELKLFINNKTYSISKSKINTILLSLILNFKLGLITDAKVSYDDYNCSINTKLKAFQEFTNRIIFVLKSDYEIIYNYMLSENLGIDSEKYILRNFGIDTNFDSSKLIGHFILPLIIDEIFNKFDKNFNRVINDVNLKILRKVKHKSI